ncbi:MAG TPA: 50S ribosomal protein L11 methyltransferase [Anaerolineae bacterium]|nr:50S ribosomal protein L11 methyltransferase [Anaerolineae bacterium]
MTDEQAEAVAEILSRFAPQGVAIEKKLVESNSYTPDMLKVYAFLLVDKELIQTKRKIEEATWHLSQIQPISQPKYREIRDQDWMTSWKEYYQPISVGKQLLILPAWVKGIETDRIPILIDPSMAFGTGVHPSTQLCLALIETYTQKGKPIIDIGCGSGILSISSILLGASHALAVDISPAAVQSTKENATLNQIASKIETSKGSNWEILSGQFSICNAHLVIVNILANTISKMLEQDLANIVADNGVLILSGILDSQASDITLCAETHGLRLKKEKKSGEWVALAFQKEQ